MKFKPSNQFSTFKGQNSGEHFWNSSRKLEFRSFRSIFNFKDLKLVWKSWKLSWKTKLKLS